MNVQVMYSKDAVRQLKKLSPALAKRIIIKIANNASQLDPLNRAKALHGRLRGKFRYRIGDYRAIFIIDDGGNIIILTVLVIKHRKDVYTSHSDLM